MKYKKIYIEPLRIFNRILKPDDNDLIAVKSGCLTAIYKNDIIVSFRKMSLAFFEAYLHGRLIKSLADSGEDHFYIKVVDEQEIKIILKSCHISTYYFPYEDNTTDVDLWNKQIKWVPCPHDLSAGIYSVAHIPPNNPENTEQEVFSGIYIDRDHVISSSDNFQHISRYKLSSTSSLSTVISSAGIKTIFGRVKDRKLLNVAELMSNDPGKTTKGIAFDFGNIRFWVPRLAINDKNILPDGPQRGGFIKYGKNSFISTVEKIFNTPCDFIVPVSPNVKPFLDCLAKLHAELFSINFINGEITFHYKDEKGSFWVESIAKIPMLNKPLNLSVNRKHFSNAVKGMRLMGLINLKDNTDIHRILYFKSGRVESILRIN